VGKAVALLGEGEMALPSLAGNVLMTVQDDLCAEGWVARHLDGDVAPLRIQDVE
jgi:hypothetical protein